MKGGKAGSRVERGRESRVPAADVLVVPAAVFVPLRRQLRDLGDPAGEHSLRYTANTVR